MGGEGKDTLFGGPGDDRIRGRAGVDRVIYAATTPVTVDLRRTMGQETGLGRDLLTRVEDVTGGTAGDHLHGSAGANRLEGLAGAIDLV